jgi:hypothetical protein
MTNCTSRKITISISMFFHTLMAFVTILKDIFIDGGMTRTAFGHTAIVCNILFDEIVLAHVTKQRSPTVRFAHQTFATRAYA